MLSTVVFKPNKLHLEGLYLVASTHGNGYCSIKQHCHVQVQSRVVALARAVTTLRKQDFMYVLDLGNSMCLTLHPSVMCLKFSTMCLDRVWHLKWCPKNQLTVPKVDSPDDSQTIDSPCCQPYCYIVVVNIRVPMSLLSLSTIDSPYIMVLPIMKTNY